MPPDSETTSQQRTLVRDAAPADVPAVLGLVRDLADYERARTEVVATEADLHRALFSAPPAAQALVAEQDARLVGMALWFRTFSTWTGRQGMHLEDLYVVPEVRGQGVGARLMAALARRCRDEGLARFEWAVLDWNAPSIGFYRRLGARPVEGWETFRLAGDPLGRLAAAGDGDEDGPG